MVLLLATVEKVTPNFYYGCSREVELILGEWEGEEEEGVVVSWLLIISVALGNA